jgi:SAM-dependent methyltransferase
LWCNSPVRGYDPSSYGDGIADVYDDWYDQLEVDAPVEALATLAAGGAVLELGIGTGRLALPLAARGLRVSGIDASPAMVAQLEAKPGGDQLEVVVGDMAGPDPSGPFSLAFAAVNTFFSLTTAEAQQACFLAVAKRLVPGGRLVIEAFVPDPDKTGDGVHVRTLTAERVVLAITSTDLGAQHAFGQLVELIDGQPVRLRPWAVRWSTPAQLDAMASAAGLGLEHRWSDWQGEPFGPDSARHVSVWRRTADVG